MRKSKFIIFYLTLLSAVFLLNGMDFWREGQSALAMTGVLGSVLSLLSLIGYMKGRKWLVWTGIVLLSAFSIYIIGALVWTFTVGVATVFSAGLFLSLVTANVLSVMKLKEQTG
ncbi:hypothetical protein [Salisediminibacterium selenitireducens]|uniref:Uncharacterized protein n=1 Tax=Bacillus selenitireducens (strain ATCC 700615 / DSM 15326 / MLS10) TaxID=439292 RepID=D6XYF3_BACIE|nr:hypothetical protein [Salisediminibacterium selenitireducens]ADI00222.1 hypothetical protein Bsel_2725 [[Bacillus] selenitireducens MLS10]